MHDLQVLHSSFMLSVVKMLLHVKGEVGGHALNTCSLEITLLIMENHGIVLLNFCGNPEHI